MNQHSAHLGNSRRPVKRAELRNNTGFAMEWTHEEQEILENCLATCPVESSVTRYARISMKLPLKTAKDVAMRCRWIKESGRVKVKNSNSAPPQDAVMDVLHYQNEQLLKQISANLTSSSNLKENVELFKQARENIMKLLDKSEENVPDQMKHMPPSPVTVRDDLFNLMLSHIYLI